MCGKGRGAIPDLVRRCPAIKLIGKKGEETRTPLCAGLQRGWVSAAAAAAASSSCCWLPVSEVALTQTGNPFTVSVCALGFTYLCNLDVTGLGAIVVVLKRMRTTSGWWRKYPDHLLKVKVQKYKQQNELKVKWILSEVYAVLLYILYIIGRL